MHVLYEAKYLHPELAQFDGWMAMGMGLCCSTAAKRMPWGFRQGGCYPCRHTHGLCMEPDSRLPLRIIALTTHKDVSRRTVFAPAVFIAGACSHSPRRAVPSCRVPLPSHQKKAPDDFEAPTEATLSAVLWRVSGIHEGKAPRERPGTAECQKYSEIKGV